MTDYFFALVLLHLLIAAVFEIARCGKRQSLFGLLLIVAWFGLFGGLWGYCKSFNRIGEQNVLIIYGFTLYGAAVGICIAYLIAFLSARSDTLPVRRSRSRGAVIGGAGGVVIGAAVSSLIFGVVIPFVVSAMVFIGSLLGMVSGLQNGPSQSAAPGSGSRESNGLQVVSAGNRR